jgi:hypothetical protein
MGDRMCAERAEPLAVAVEAMLAGREADHESA